MMIEGSNQKEIEKQAEFHKGNRKAGLEAEEEFAKEFREEQEKDHCSCKKCLPVRSWEL